MAEPAPTYHVDIWTVPDPTYVCCFCIPTARYTLEGVTAHLREVHDCDAIPTPHMDSLLAIRAESDARAAAAATVTPPGAPLAPAEAPPSAAPGPPPAPNEPAAPGETPAAASPAPPEEHPSHA